MSYLPLFGSRVASEACGEAPEFGLGKFRALRFGARKGPKPPGGFRPFFGLPAPMVWVFFWGGVCPPAEMEFFFRTPKWKTWSHQSEGVFSKGEIFLGS